jgi:hypothetical protein
VSERLSRLIFGFSLALGALGAGTALAQDYSAGKTPAQLFQSDCSTCHKSPQGLAKGQDVRSLTTFLKEHYTTKDESAVALASYLGANDRQKAAVKPKPEPKPGAVGTAEGEGSKPASKPRTAANPAAAIPSNPEEKAAEGEARPASRSATRAAEPHAAHRRAAVPTPPEPVPQASVPTPSEPVPQADSPREPAAAAETSIMREEPMKPREEPAKPTAQHERARPARHDPTGDKLKSYASSGGSAKELERSADPSRKLQSYATSGTPAAIASPDAPKDAPPAATGTIETSSPPAETAAPPADAVKPIATPKKRSAAAGSAVSTPANPPRRPRAQRRTQAPIQPVPGNN